MKNKLKGILIARIAFFTLLLMACIYIAYCACHGVDSEWSYSGWTLSELLINYEGGFVRRGLWGELLLLLYGAFSCPVRDVAFIVVLSGVLCLLALLVRIFIKEGWSVMILVAPFLLLSMIASANGNLLWCRRDAWMLVFIYGIFKLYRRYIDTNKKTALFLMNVLAVVSILSYEPSFLMCVPLLFSLRYTQCRAATYSHVRSLFSATSLILPAAFTFVLVCLNKGNQEIVDAIWQSWAPCVECYPLGPSEVGPSIKALAWDAQSAVIFHLEVNLLGYNGKMPRCLMFLLCFVSYYYLTTRLNTVNPRFNELKQADGCQISNFLLAQFVFMFPLFSFMACDSGRNVPFWIISSLFAYHVFRRWECPLISGISRHIQKKLDRCAMCANSYVYLAVLFLAPLCGVGAPALSAVFRRYASFIHAGLSLIDPQMSQRIREIVENLLF